MVILEIPQIEVVMRLLTSIALSVSVLFFLPSSKVNAENLNIFSRNGTTFIWPVKGVKLAPAQSEVSNRITKVFTINELHSARSQGRLRIGSIVADFSRFKTHLNLDGICVLTNNHFSSHEKEYARKFGSALKDIPIIDQYATRSGRNVTLQLSASVDAGLLSALFPNASFTGFVKVELVSKNARDRFIEKASDRNFLLEKLRAGPICRDQKLKKYASQKKYFLDNFTYGDFKPKTTLKVGILGFGSEVIYGEDLYGAFLFRPSKKL